MIACHVTGYESLKVTPVQQAFIVYLKCHQHQERQQQEQQQERVQHCHRSLEENSVETRETVKSTTIHTLKPGKEGYRHPSLFHSPSKRQDIRQRHLLVVIAVVKLLMFLMCQQQQQLEHHLHCHPDHDLPQQQQPQLKLQLQLHQWQLRRKPLLQWYQRQRRHRYLSILQKTRTHHPSNRQVYVRHCYLSNFLFLYFFFFSSSSFYFINAHVTFRGPLPSLWSRRRGASVCDFLLLTCAPSSPSPSHCRPSSPPRG